MKWIKSQMKMRLRLRLIWEWEFIWELWDDLWDFIWEFIWVHVSSYENYEMTNESSYELIWELWISYEGTTSWLMWLMSSFVNDVLIVKQYGLSSVTLNFLCGIISVEWAALVIGFFNLHSKATIVAPNGTIVEESFKVRHFLFFFTSRKAGQHVLQVQEQ